MCCAPLGLGSQGRVLGTLIQITTIHHLYYILQRITHSMHVASQLTIHLSNQVDACPVIQLAGISVFFPSQGNGFKERLTTGLPLAQPSCPSGDFARTVKRIKTYPCRCPRDSSLYNIKMVPGLCRGHQTSCYQTWEESVLQVLSCNMDRYVTVLPLLRS